MAFCLYCQNSKGMVHPPDWNVVNFKILGYEKNIPRLIIFTAKKKGLQEKPASLLN